MGLITIKKNKSHSNVGQPKVVPVESSDGVSETAVNDNLDTTNVSEASDVAPALVGDDLVDVAPPDELMHPKDELPGIVDPDDDDDADGAECDDIELTEDAAADRFVCLHGDRLRYDHESGSWYHWTGSRWKKTKTGLSFHLARLLLRKMRGGITTRMATKRAVEGVEGMVARDPLIAVTSEIWDANPHLLGTPEGTVDLKTGELLAPNPENYISRQTVVAPAPSGAKCPEFMKFLHDATGGDTGVQRLLQQYAGYCLTGLTIQQVLLFVYGPGGNGKSVLQTVIKEVLGDYAVTLAMETFVASKHQRHLTELAMLHGARFVGASETEKGLKWSEARIYQLTGGDPVTANFMRKDHFTFIPQFKLMVVGNHKPNLTSVNDAARRRFIIVPFLNKPNKPDPTLLEKLRAEFPAILRWMIEGCLDWQKNGLVIPEPVKKATEDYFKEQDTYGRWIEECCEWGLGKKAKALVLYQSYVEFCAENGEQADTNVIFADVLGKRGFEKKKSGGNFYHGITLKSLSNVNFADDM